MPTSPHALKINTISLSTFKSTLSRYPEHIPDSLAELDVFRSTTLPERLREQRQEQIAESSSNANINTSNTEKKVKKKAKRGLGGLTWTGGGGPPPTARKGRGPHLTKEELVKLVEWKLKHGTFRPTLLSLVSSNPDATITSLTTTVFHSYYSSIDNLSDSPESDIPSLVSRLTALKGVGPATASLILSTLDPERVPFFGDELFRWAMWDTPAPSSKGPSGSTKGWKRKIGYNAKEYVQLVDVVEQVRIRLDVGVDEIERVAFVLGKEGLDLDSDEVFVDEDDDEEEEAVDAAAKKASSKRKTRTSSSGAAVAEVDDTIKRRRT